MKLKVSELRRTAEKNYREINKEWIAMWSLICGAVVCLVISGIVGQKSFFAESIAMIIGFGTLLFVLVLSFRYDNKMRDYVDAFIQARIDKPDPLKRKARNSKAIGMD